MTPFSDRTPKSVGRFVCANLFARPQLAGGRTIQALASAVLSIGFYPRHFIKTQIAMVARTTMSPTTIIATTFT
jgi:hypothetical protein